MASRKVFCTQDDIRRERKPGAMSRSFLNQLSDGDAVDEVFLLADKQLRANRNANLYLLANLRDKTGLISGLMWNVTEDSVAHVHAGDFVKVKGKVQLYQGALQMILTHIQTVPPEGFDAADFYPESGQDVERLSGRLREILLSIEEPNLRTLMECFLVDEAIMADFCRAPAGVKAHHAYHGGLLEHVVNILETAHRIADLYPKLDVDLLLAGIFLHDLGKTEELSQGLYIDYTTVGKLVGHLAIGLDMANEKMRAIEGFPDALRMELQHLILSHHATLEQGSPTVPKTLEAMVLALIDDLDAQTDAFNRVVEETRGKGQAWSEFLPIVERQIWARRTPPE